MKNDARRLSILSTDEIDELFGLPHFSDDDRRLYFDLSAKERELFDNTRTFSVAAHLVLQLGYFKAKRQFFSYEQESSVLNDLDYIAALYFPTKTLSRLKSPSRPIRAEQQRAILDLFQYKQCDNEVKVDLEDKAQRVAMLSTQPIFIFRELTQYLALHRIVMPSYRYMQEMIGRVVAYERTRIARLLSTCMTSLIDQQLAALLRAESGVFRVSALKHEAKDFSYKELRHEVARRQFFQPLHEFAKQFLITAGISNESGKYYASMVKFYTTYKLQRMKKETAQLYLLFFAFHRFQQINDNLIEALLHWVDQYEKQAKRAAEEAMNNAVTNAAKNLQAAGHVLSLFTDDTITDDTPFSVIKERAYALLEQERFPLVADYLRNIAFDKTAFEWSHYTKLSATFKRNLRQLFTDLDFAGRVEDSPLLEAIGFLQNLLRTEKSPRQTDPSSFPTEIIPKGLRRYLFSKEGKTFKTLDVHIPADHEHQFRFNVNTISGPM